MTADRLCDYLPRVFGYAVRHTDNAAEAEELAAEILFTALNALPAIKNDDRFEPWLWGVAANVTRAFRRKCSRRRALYSYDALDENAFYEEPVYFSAEETEAEYGAVRRALSMLSAGYREILILHYYRGMTVDEIADALSLPRGTVTWRLSEGRRKIKKGLETNMKETALFPHKMNMDIFGMGEFNGKNIPFPTEFIRDALAQNILYHAYEKPRTAEELAQLCGVPAYYIEDRVRDLVAREAMCELPNRTYRTDFPIQGEEHADYLWEATRKALAPLCEGMLSALDAIADDMKAVPHYRAQRTDEALWYVYAALAFTYFEQEYNLQTKPQIKEKRDGHRWSYIGFTSDKRGPRLSHNTSGNGGAPGKYRHCVWGSIANIRIHRPMMVSSSINVCAELLARGTTDDLVSLADSIASNHVRREDDGRLTVLVPALTVEEKRQFFALVKKYLAPFTDAYNAAIAEVTRGYRRMFPAHLGDITETLCAGMFVGGLSVLIAWGQKNGTVPRVGDDTVCDMLVEI